MQFNLSHCLLAILVVALALGLITNSVRHQREISDLRASIGRSRDTLHKIHYGNANLQLLELHPAIADDRECSRFLRHELAGSILEHWRSQKQIDILTGTENYSRDFTARALVFFEISSASDFADLANSELSIYPCDPLKRSVFDMSEDELKSFDTFIRSALAVD